MVIADANERTVMRLSARLAAIALALVSGPRRRNNRHLLSRLRDSHLSRPCTTRLSAAQPRATTARVIVRDRSGTALGDVHIAMSGPVSQEVVTDASGMASVGTTRDGSYRLRFERDGFITLEREISVAERAAAGNRRGAERGAGTTAAPGRGGCAAAGPGRATRPATGGI